MLKMLSSVVNKERADWRRNNTKKYYQEVYWKWIFSGWNRNISSQWPVIKKGNWGEYRFKVFIKLEFTVIKKKIYLRRVPSNNSLLLRSYFE